MNGKKLMIKYDRPHLSVVKTGKIDPYTIDSEEMRQVTVSSVVEIGPFEGTEVPSSWVPPDWNFDYYSYSCISGTSCENCSCLL